MKPNLNFKSIWLAEIIRLIETQQGTYSSDLTIKQIAANHNSFAQKIIERSSHLASKNGINNSVDSLIKSSKLALMVIIAVSILFAVISTKSALNSGGFSVNIFTVLVALLGVHLLTFVFWLFSFFVNHKDQPYGLGSVWLWLSKRLNSKSGTGYLIPQALTATLARQNAFKPMLGIITNGLWLIMLITASVTLLALLSTKSYTFHWETTLLSPSVFVSITSTLAWLPGLFGFKSPDAHLIELSNVLYDQTPQAATLWSHWLIANILFYGIAVRFMAVVTMAIILHVRIKNIQLDVNLTGYIELYDQLMPLSKGEIVDAPAPEYVIGSVSSTLYRNNITKNANAIIAIEMPPLKVWPPFSLSDKTIDLGRIDSSIERKQAINTLIQNSPNKLLIIVDAKQTPDRGSIRLILELQHLAQQSIILLLDIENDLNLSQSRQDIWTSYLKRAGVSETDIHNSIDFAQQWLMD